MSEQRASWFRNSDWGFKTVGGWAFPIICFLGLWLLGWRAFGLILVGYVVLSYLLDRWIPPSSPIARLLRPILMDTGHRGPEIYTNLLTVPKEGMSAEQFLRWSMDKHAELKSLQTRMSVSGMYHQEKQIEIELPNRFRVNCKIESFEITSVCDGARIIEYSSDRDQEVLAYPAPESIAEAKTAYLLHPMFCGSLLFRFFAGSEGFDRLVWTHCGEVEYGGSTCLKGGETATAVKFYGLEQYGNVVALIGLETGLVYRLAYDSAELFKMMNEPAVQRARLQAARSAANTTNPKWLRPIVLAFNRWAMERANRTDHQWSTQVFEAIRLNEPIPIGVFDTSPPVGIPVKEMSDRGKPPVPIGDPAPDFTVRSLSGDSLRLSELRGKVVLIDLWATWCGPCREGLPDTMELAELGTSEGFQVLAISSDDLETIADFVRDEGLTKLPAYADTTGAVWSTYKVDSIPTAIVIDAAGNLTEYSVGLRPKEEILAAIRAAKNHL